MFLQQPTVNILNVQEQELCNQLPEMLNCPSSNQNGMAVYSHHSLGILVAFVFFIIQQLFYHIELVAKWSEKETFFLISEFKSKLQNFLVVIIFFWFPLFFCINEPQHSWACSFGLPKYGSLKMAHLNLNKWVVGSSPTVTSCPSRLFWMNVSQNTVIFIAFTFESQLV